MPVYLEYDKTNGKITKILTADSLPANVAYLAYQEIPDNVFIDTSSNIREIIEKITDLNIEEKENNSGNSNEEIEIIEV